VVVPLGECTRAARKENPNPNPNSHEHCLLSKWKCRTRVCVYSSVQLDKSRVEKEFTANNTYTAAQHAGSWSDSGHTIT